MCQSLCRAHFIFSISEKASSLNLICSISLSLYTVSILLSGIRQSIGGASDIDRGGGGWYTEEKVCLFGGDDGRGYFMKYEKNCAEAQNGKELSGTIEALGGEGGKVRLACGCCEAFDTVCVDAPCICVEGEVWSYSCDPNGVFESHSGSKLRLKGQGFPAFSVGVSRTAQGLVMRDFGIQGDIEGMDTRPLFDFAHPERAAGICFSGTRVDQGQVSKVSFCGLGAAICAMGEAELDACRFEHLNTDGCAVGFFFAPRASYYTLIGENVSADHPYYGLYADGGSYQKDGAAKNRSIHNLEICGNHFVRCGGAFDDASAAAGMIPAAVYLRDISDSLVRDNLIDSAGVFWYYAPDARSNGERQPQKRRTPALIVEGDRNRLMGNVITGSSAESVIIRGNGNVLLCNIVDGDVVIEGSGNTVSNLVFTTEQARLVLKKGTENSVGGVSEERIVYVD